MRPLSLPLLVLPLLLAACVGDEDLNTTPADTLGTATAPSDAAAMEATAMIEPLGDSGVTGTVTFRPAEGGLQVTYALEGLEPGQHGFHVHENGDCGPGEDGTPGGAAGGHFAPMDDPHGAPSDPAGQRHVGDFGNVEAGADGRAAGTFVDPVAAFDGATGIVGKAVVVHAAADDLTSQPSGDAGGRVGCGVVGMTGAGALPPGHPPVGLPPGHPPIDGAPAGDGPADV